MLYTIYATIFKPVDFLTDKIPELTPNEFCCNNKLLQQRVNIDVRPARNYLEGVTSITIGDLHGNAIKLLYFLVCHGVCDISEESYARLVAIYHTTHNLYKPRLDNRERAHYKKIIDEFNQIINEINIIDRNILVKLIGDELADRGGNDYFVLKILQKLHQGRVCVTILLSNHGVEFIEAYERYTERKKLYGTVIRPKACAQSLYKLAILIDNDLVSFQEISEIVEKCYMPSLKLLDFSLNGKSLGISIFSHAPIGMTEIRLLSNKMCVAFDASTSKKLADTINRINKHFFIHYVSKNKVNELYHHGEVDFADAPVNQDIVPVTLKVSIPIPPNEENVVNCILWNRCYETLDRPNLHNDYPMRFVHGHDSSGPKDEEYIVNLNNQLGVSPRHHKGLYSVLLSDEKHSQRHMSRRDQPFDLKYLQANLRFVCISLTSLYIALRIQKALLPELTFFSTRIEMDGRIANAISDMNKI